MPIRQPSTEDDLYRFWRRAVAGERMARIEDEPQPGFYRMRIVKGGPWLPVEIWMEQQIDTETGELVADERLRAICAGEHRNSETIWTHVRPISTAEYDALTGVREAVADMKATHVALDLGAMAPILP